MENAAQDGSQELSSEVESANGVLVQTEDVLVDGLAQVLAGAPLTDMWALGRILGRAADAEPDAAKARMHRLLAQLSYCRLVVEGPEPYRAGKVEDERRWEIPSDFDGAQNNELARIVEHIPHPGLKARTADIVFYNDRKQGRAAVSAVDAYAETIEAEIRRLGEGGVPELEQNGFDLIWLAVRAIQIARMSTKAKGVPARLGAAVLALYNRSRDRGDVVAFHHIAEAAATAKVVGWDVVGADSEAIADGTAAGTYDMPVYTLLIFAGRAYERAQRHDDKARAWEKSLNVQLRLRDAAPLATVKAHLTQKALRYARAHGLRHRVVNLRDQLRRFEQESVDDVRPFSTSYDLSNLHDLIDEEFESLTLSQVLRSLATISSPVTLDEVRQSAERTHGNGYFSNMFGSIHNDVHGRQSAYSNPASQKNSEDSSWFREQAYRYVEANCRIVVKGMIEPAGQRIQDVFPIEARHFHIIAVRSPFVPTGFEHIFSIAFARFWQGDQITAAHLLIPQIEGILRHVLDMRGIAIATLHDDGNQEDRGIGVLLTQFREPLMEIFGADILFTIDLLFSTKPGPNLRNELAHGKLSVMDCYSAPAIYACWFTYRLICLPLLDNWDENVTPNLEPVVRM